MPGVLLVWGCCGHALHWESRGQLVSMVWLPLQGDVAPAPPTSTAANPVADTVGTSGSGSSGSATAGPLGRAGEASAAAEEEVGSTLQEHLCVPGALSAVEGVDYKSLSVIQSLSAIPDPPTVERELGVPRERRKQR